MPAIQTQSGKIIYFAHCPKAGGSSIEDYLRERYETIMLLDRNWNKVWRLKNGWRDCRAHSSPQHLIWEEALVRLPRVPDHVFTVVRDPVARMVSEYSYQRSRRRTGRLGQRIGQLDFSTWLRIMLRGAVQNPYLYDNHFRPQVAFMPANGVKVFRLEDGLHPVVEWLDRVSGGTAPNIAIPHAMSSSKDAGIALRRQDIDLIASVFAEDYARFNYPFLETAFLSTDRATSVRWLTAALFGPAVAGLYRRGWL